MTCDGWSVCRSVGVRRSEDRSDNRLILVDEIIEEVEEVEEGNDDEDKEEEEEEEENRVDEEDELSSERVVFGVCEASKRICRDDERWCVCLCLSEELPVRLFLTVELSSGSTEEAPGVFVSSAKETRPLWCASAEILFVDKSESDG